MICFPECFAYMGVGGDKQFVENVQTGTFINKYKELAKSNNVYLSLGGFQEALSEDDPNFESKRYNSHLVIDSNGEVISVYRKTHLYDVDLAKYVQGGVSIKESDYIESGQKILPPLTPNKTPGW